MTDQTAKRGFYKESSPESMLFKWFFTLPLNCLQINRIWRGSPIEGLNEKQKHDLESLEDLKEKSYRSDFNKKLTNKIIKLASEWIDRFHPKVIKKKKASNRIVCTTPFRKLLRLSSKEKSLKPEAIVTYRNPPTLSNNLLNYKQLAFQANHDRR